MPAIKSIEQNESIITIQWNSANGIVDYYSIILKLGDDTVANETVYNSTEIVTFPDLRGDTTYILKMITHTETLDSKTLERKFKTNITSKFFSMFLFIVCYSVESK